MPTGEERAEIGAMGAKPATLTIAQNRTTTVDLIVLVVRWSRAAGEEQQRRIR